MRTVCEINKCTGCAACLDACSKKAINIADGVDFYNAIIDEALCVNCGLCKKVCQKANSVSLRKPMRWYQGWADDDVRKESSSGGYAAAIMRAFISKGGYICACRFLDGVFKYLITNNANVQDFVGSKYVKSNPNGCYKKIDNILKSGKKVLFIGLPCHVAGLKLYIDSRLENQLYTIDLICHGSPSPKLIKSFLEEKGYSIEKIKDIKFRKKNKFNVYTDYKCIVTEGTRDRYTMGFLRGLFYTENCYECRYAQLERVGDLTIGDSWGTELTSEEAGGISLALCQTDKGIELLEISGVILKNVDIDRAIMANRQLDTPYIKPKEREIFFKEYKKNGRFSRAVAKCYPKDCFKQDLKGLLIRCGVKF